MKFSPSVWFLQQMLRAIAPGFVLLASALPCFAAEKGKQNPPSKAAAKLAPQTNQKSRVTGHWGEGAVGFRWEEGDSADARWNQTEIGPMLSSALAAPGGMINKAISIQIGEQANAAVCFDKDKLQMRCGWLGDFLAFTPSRYGLIAPPRIAGTLRFHAPAGPGWDAAKREYKGLYQNGRRIVLSYAVEGVSVLESPWLESHGNQIWFTRTLEIGPSATSLEVVVAAAKTQVRLEGEQNIACVVARPDAPVKVAFTPHEGTVRIKILIAGGKPLTPVQNALPHRKTSVGNLTAFTTPGAPLWKQTLETQGTLGQGEGPYVVDTITLPFENPWRALLFVGGHDFFSQPGRAALCTAHGDVWLIDGLDARLKHVRWRRFATGLFQPLGLRIVNDQVYVLGRDQITRLHDRNHDGEADFYETFNDDAQTSAAGHDFSTCLETDPAGNFYYISQQGVHRISKEGRQHTIIATGLRNPNGMSVGPQGVITAAPQEGEWTPASAIYEVAPGGYYGYGGPRIAPKRPLGYDQPLCWIPRRVDNSCGGQVWVTSNRWGPLSNQLLHLSFGQCRLYLVLREKIGQITQGGLAAFPLYFDSGVMRGRFSPHDGQLYVSGLRGWVSAAVQDGCLQRVRYTGAPITIPVGVRTLNNGVSLTFATPLDKQSAEDPGNYHIEQWNYIYSKNYGSLEYKPSSPGSVGRDEVEVRSATLLNDHTLFLECSEVRPVMQMAIRYALKTADQRPIRDVYHHTIKAVSSKRIAETRLVRRPQTGHFDDALQKRLQPGLAWSFQSTSKEAASASSHFTDTRIDRMAALTVLSGKSPTPFLPPGPFTAHAQAYIKVAFKDDYTLHAQGRGGVLVRINDEAVMDGRGNDLSQLARRTVRLHKGYNRLEIVYQSPPAGGANFRLLWETPASPKELLPATTLFHDTKAVQRSPLRQGRTLFAQRRCHRCHRLPASLAAAQEYMPELALDAPHLATSGQRLTTAWLAQWIYAPHKLRSSATMPALLNRSHAAGRQQAADLAAWLATLRKPTAAAAAPSHLKAEEQNAEKKKALVERGAVLFEDLGCIACHRLSEESVVDDFQRLSLHYVSAKFRPGALRAFLKTPHKHFRWSRMPDFHLADDEASALAAWLRKASLGRSDDWAGNLAGDAARGRTLFGKLRCSACHASDGPAVEQNQTPAEYSLTLFATSSIIASPRDAAVLFAGAAASGCLADAPARNAAPDHHLTLAEKAALRSFLQTDGRSLARRNPVEFSHRAMQRLACNACHTRDAQNSPRGEIMIDEGLQGLPPEPLPNLTWTGEKLHADWLARFLGGQISKRPRPWLKARMPAFPAYAAALAEGIAHEHGVLANAPAPARFDETLVAMGRRLTLKTALDCRQCHGVGPLEPRGDDRTKIALGVNFALIRDRLRSDYYQRFVLDPPRYDISTKMPKLAVDGLHTKVTAIFKGDAKQQFHAIWRYILYFDQRQPVSEPKPAAK